MSQLPESKAIVIGGGIAGLVAARVLCNHFVHVIVVERLGTARIATRNLTFRSFEDTRAFVRALKLRNQIEWNMYCKLGKKPSDIPQKTKRTYRNQGWISYGDWLGYKEYTWSVSKLKELYDL